MSIPNVSSVLSGWTQTVGLKTVTTTTVDFVPSQSVSSVNISAVVQPADQEVLQALEIDYSLRYIQVHTTTTLIVGKYITYNSTDYKIIRLLQYGDYGYYEAVCEEVKGGLI